MGEAVIRQGEHRRRGLVAGLAMLVAGTARPSLAQPEARVLPVPRAERQPTVVPPVPDALRIVHGFTPTSAVDVISRALGAQMRAEFVPRVAVAHQTGGAGRRVVAALRRHADDDELMLVTPGSVLTMLPHADRSPNYDPFRDLRPVCALGHVNLALAVGPAVPASVRTLEAFVAWCRWQHDTTLCGNAGFGSYAHFATVLLGQSAGLPLEPIPYRNELASVRATAGGEVAAVIAREWAVLPYARAGRVRVLATSGARRSRFQLQTPTFVEAGIPMLERGDWLGAFLPSGVPEDRAWALAEIIGDTLRDTELRDVMLRLSFDPAGGTPEMLAEMLRVDHEFWGPVVKASGYLTGNG